VKDMNMMRFFLHAMKIFIIFIICTLSFYFALIWIHKEYENYNRYDQPEGNAIKVNSYRDETKNDFASDILDRLKLFLKLSE